MNLILLFIWCSGKRWSFLETNVGFEPGLSKTELFSKVTELEGSVTEPNLFLIAMSD